MTDAGDDIERPLVAHLLELRSRLLRGATGLLLALLCLLPFANTLYAWLAQPLLDKLPAGGQLIATANGNITNGDSVVDTLHETVDCPEPMFEDVPVDDNADSDGEGSGAGLPDTGSETTLAWLAAAALLVGFGALRLARREDTLIAE